MSERFDPEEGSRTVEERFASRVTMNVPDRHNPRLHRVMDLVNQDDDLYALWLAANVNAVERLGMTDHGPVHVKIVMNIAVRMLRLLSDAGVEPSVTTHPLRSSARRCGSGGSAGRPPSRRRHVHPPDRTRGILTLHRQRQARRDAPSGLRSPCQHYHEIGGTARDHRTPFRRRTPNTGSGDRPHRRGPRHG